MSTVIYLANQQIQVITGTPGNRKISVADCYTEDAPDGEKKGNVRLLSAAPRCREPHLYTKNLFYFWRKKQWSRSV